MPLAVDVLESVRVGLSGLNDGINLGMIADATVNGANTYATFRSRVLQNVNAETNSEEKQAGFMLVLRGLDIGNAAGILTDTNLNGKTTTAQLQALFTAEDPRLAAGYSASSPQ